MKKIYMVKVVTRYFDRCNSDRTIEYERDRYSGNIIEDEHVGYFDSVEEAKGMMLQLERNMHDSGSFEKEYFQSIGNDRIHIVRYSELDVKGKVTKAGTGFESRLTIIPIELGKMLY